MFEVLLQHIVFPQVEVKCQRAFMAPTQRTKKNLSRKKKKKLSFGSSLTWSCQRQISFSAKTKTIITIFSPFLPELGLTGLLEPLRAGQGKVTPWTGRQLDAGPQRENKDKQGFALTHTHGKCTVSNSPHIHIFELLKEDGEHNNAGYKKSNRKAKGWESNPQPFC